MNVRAIFDFNLIKDLEKDTDREEHQRGDARGCKHPLLEPEPATALELPTDM